MTPLCQSISRHSREFADSPEIILRLATRKISAAATSVRTLDTFLGCAHQTHHLPTPQPGCAPAPRWQTTFSPSPLPSPHWIPRHTYPSLSSWSGGVGLPQTILDRQMLHWRVLWSSPHSTIVDIFRPLGDFECVSSWLAMFRKRLCFDGLRVFLCARSTSFVIATVKVCYKHWLLTRENQLTVLRALIAFWRSWRAMPESGGGGSSGG